MAQELYPANYIKSWGMNYGNWDVVSSCSTFSNGYIHMIRRFWKLVKSNKKVKLKAITFDKKTVLLFINIDICLFLKIVRTAGSDMFVIWCVVFVLETTYTAILLSNYKYAYICEGRIIFADCVKKAEDYSYRIEDNILEIQPSKPPRNIERFEIECDMDLLMDIIKKYRPLE